MSHYVCLVIGENPEGQLEKYDENIEMPQYVSKTKEQIIEDRLAWVEEYKNTTYAGFLEDPEQYQKDASEGHFKFISEEFPKMMEMTGEELYQLYVDDYGHEAFDENGGKLSTYNPLSKWDWYVLGGRWSGEIKVKEGAEAILGAPGVFGRTEEVTGFDCAEKGDILNLDELKPFAIVKDGEWYQRGEMGWWGMVSNEQDPEEWKTKVSELLNDLPDNTMISMFDCHI